MATNLPGFFSHQPRCYASIAVGSGPEQTTEAVKGASPAWDKTFIFEATSTSTFSINIVRESRWFGRKVIAKLEDVVIPPGSFEKAIATTHHLRSSSKNVKVDINWSPVVVTDEAPAAAEASIATTKVDVSPPPVTSDEATTVPISTIKDVQDILEKRGPANSRSIDRLETVLNYVGVLVKIGDQLTEVHPIAKAVWTIFEAQLEREAKVRELWDIIIDTLDFMEEAEPLKKVRGLETTMQAIMSQLYDCALHLKAYERQGFL
ncbi:hypothetical protein DXG03_003922, partial [Asterophora parasitica]